MVFSAFIRLSLEQKILWLVALAAVAAGLFFRVNNLTASGFFFYDEGFYLQHNLPVLEFVKNHPMDAPQDRQMALYYYLRSALGSGKSLWFLIMDSRFLWGGIYDWTFSKSAACLLGVAAIPLVFWFAWRFFASITIALLAVILYSVLPGAVFYSRIGLQEALSILLVLSGFFFYFFPRQFGWRTFLSGALLGLAFFSNYRLVMLPVLVGALELWLSGVCRYGSGLRKYVWAMLTFFACVVLGGSLLGGVNTQVIAAWVFHHGQGAEGQFAWINLLSYPYYIFSLETFLFAAAFFGGIYFLVRRNWSTATLVILPLFHMAFFSLTPEKGARYTAVMLPFMVMVVAALVREAYLSSAGVPRKILVFLVAVMVLLMAGRSWELTTAVSGHKMVTEKLVAADPAVKFVSSQEMVDSLYVLPHDRVKAVPPGFEALLMLYSKGYRYLILDPQSGVSLTAERKFVLPLKDYLAFIDKSVQPIAVVPHMNRALLERFVFEHSENLGDSVRFLALPEVMKYGSIRVYDLDVLIPDMNRLYQVLRARAKG